MTKNCLVCNKEFYAKANRVKQGLAKFCSRPCFNHYFSKNYCGENSKKWKNGQTKCKVCGKVLSGYAERTYGCRDCYKKNNPPSKFKGANIQFNTGRTHFKKGRTPWNKGKKIIITEKMQKANERRRGIPQPKPSNFSEIMRKTNPPKGKKIKWGETNKALRTWRKGYVYIYLPDYPYSKKTPPDYGYIAEHRYIIEKEIGRKLERGECVHHIDGDKGNNKLDNLLLCHSTKEHTDIHTKMYVFMEKLIRDGLVKYDRKNKTFEMAYAEDAKLGLYYDKDTGKIINESPVAEKPAEAY